MQFSVPHPPHPGIASYVWKPVQWNSNSCCNSMKTDFNTINHLQPSISQSVTNDKAFPVIPHSSSQIQTFYSPLYSIPNSNVGSNPRIYRKVNGLSQKVSNAMIVTVV